jgi:DNA-binding NarL/FixJ family response regulator
MSWTPEEDQRLLEMKACGMQVAMIAKTLRRTEAATSSRLSILKKKSNGKTLAVNSGGLTSFFEH